jgi:hypothetical protein
MAEEQKQEMQGAFVASLKRNNKQIKDDRADAITEMAQMRYRRTVEDLNMDIKRMKRTRESMLDLSPENSFSLMVANNFDSEKFVEEDLKLGVKIREAEIKLEIAQSQYNYLFGGV